MDPLQAPGPDNTGGCLRYKFQFSPNGTSAPTGLIGQFVQSVTATGSTTTFLYLVTMCSNDFKAIRGFNASIIGSAAGPAQAFTFQLDTVNTNLTASTGAVIAIAAVNSTTGARTSIAADSPAANTILYFEIDFSVNTALW